MSPSEAIFTVTAPCVTPTRTPGRTSTTPPPWRTPATIATSTSTVTLTVSWTRASSAPARESGPSRSRLPSSAVTAAAQALVFALSGSLALLADLIHNGGDALTAIPLGVAFALRSPRAERLAGLAVVAAIFISACVAAYESIHAPASTHPRLAICSSSRSPEQWLASQATRLPAQVRTRAGRRLDSACADRGRQITPAPTRTSHSP